MSDESERYELEYQSGYGIQFPESTIVRVNKRVLEWELGLTSGKLLDFGCGSGAHLAYFSECGFEPYGCDTSKTAIEGSHALLPRYSENVKLCSAKPELDTLFHEAAPFDLLLANQVLYYLPDEHMRLFTQQAYSLLRPGGVIVASLMSPSSFYSDYITGSKGDFSVVELDTQRLKTKTLINFKKREEVPALFEPFSLLHLGSYGLSILSDERNYDDGSDHWLYIGIKKE